MHGALQGLPSWRETQKAVEHGGWSYKELQSSGKDLREKLKGEDVDGSEKKMKRAVT